MELILTHNNADFDAVASLLGAHKLHPVAVPVLPQRLNRNVAEFITLYQNGLPFVRWKDFRPSRIERVILVDTQRTPDMKNLKPDTPTTIIDHHPKSDDLGPHVTFTGDEIGSTAALLVEQIRAQKIALTSLEATLLALGIYSDTGALTYGTTTARDILAAAWLLEQNAVLDTVRRFLSPPLSDEQQQLLDALVANVDSRSVQGYTVTVCAATFDEYVPQVNSIAHRLRDVLDPEALFVIAAMPGSTQMVCRSATDAVDVGEIARAFGGGGHPRAAAAKIDDMALDDITGKLWTELESAVKPVTRVADLMSYGVQTVAVDDKINVLIHQLRRIGHEGYPVVEDGRVVGLLTRRDADRALEHGLSDTRVRDVMSSGEITLKPDDSVSALEQRMVESDWGQIPVINDDGTLIGIVTRTDLIKHWARVHPAVAPPQERIEPEQIRTVMGEPAAIMIEAISAYVRESRLNLYLVGGVVRDLLLERPNLDLDLVVEDDAIRLAEDLRALFGGEVNSYRPFGTAKWKLDESVAVALGLEPDAIHGLPDTIDFATSRNEFYEHPTALPSVYSSSIKLDLHRRDFTINTLAVQLSPEPAAYRLLDFYGGLADLRNGTIRALHSLSFVDDPTRVLRAVRFEHRLDFHIETRTSELIKTAHPMLRRITGERLRNEMNLLLRENEPERALLRLEARGILSAIHPSLTFSPYTSEDFQRARATRADWPLPDADEIEMLWHLLLIRLPIDEVKAIAERMMSAGAMRVSYMAAAELLADLDSLRAEDAPPSTVTARLDDIPELALLACWIIVEDDSLPRERIERYLREWRHIRPVSDGHTLREMGLPPGPRYREILIALRDARLDGLVSSDDEERRLLDQLVKDVTGEDRDHT